MEQEGMTQRQKRFVAMMTAVGSALLFLVCLVGACAIVMADTSKSDSQMSDFSGMLEKQNGCPLDAISYQSPAFTGNDIPLYKVTDRSSGKQWWIFTMNGEIVSLPIGE